MTPIVYFLHGRDSSPASTKIQKLSMLAKERGWKVIAPDYSGISDPDRRADLFMEQVHRSEATTVVVGSSMGAYVGLIGSRKLQPDALLLLAPAVHIQGYKEQAPEPQASETTIIHGWGDELIGADAVYRFAKKHKADLHLVDDGHTLSQQIAYIESVFIQLLDRLAPSSPGGRLMAVL